MAWYALLREINPHTYLRLTYRGEATCLRDYSRGPNVEPLTNRRHRLTEIRDLAERPGNEMIPAPPHGLGDWPYWHGLIVALNGGEVLIEGEGKCATVHPVDEPEVAVRGSRLLDFFRDQIQPLFGKPDALTDTMKDWIGKFRRVQEKTRFNHWDVDEARDQRKDTGNGWTSVMLEACRLTGSLNYLNTTRSDLDLALLSMELNLGISSKKNNDPT